MKWVWIVLGGILGLVLLGVLILFALGFRSSAGHMTSSIEIDRPPDAVWPFLTQPDKEKQWISWLSEVRDESPGTEGIGKKLVWVMADPNMRQPVEIEQEIVEEVPLRRLSVHMTSKLGFDGIATWSLEDLGGRTRFTSDGTFHYRQWMARLFEPLITPQARKKLAMDQAALKKAVESAR